MSKPVTIGQSHNAMSILANNTDWSTLNSEMLQKVIDNPRTVGTQFTLFLKNGGKMMLGSSNIVPIYHNRFNPKKFLGDGWSIQNDETDARSIALTELDLTKVELVTMLKDGETCIQGEEKLKRLKSSDYIRLDADIFLALWENQHFIPESWKEKVNGNIRYIFFDGTVLQSPLGGRCVLFLYWGGGEWFWDCYWLDDDWQCCHLSAVLAG